MTEGKVKLPHSVNFYLFVNAAMRSFFIHRVRVHRIILAATSNYYATIFGSKSANECCNEIVLTDFDGTLLTDLVHYLYTGNVTLNVKNFKAYMDVAVQFEFKLLQKKCIEFPIIQLSLYNCVEYFLLANTNNSPDLRKNALQFICNRFKNVPSREISKLDFDSFKEVIESDEITATEELVFDRLVEWTRCDEFDRSKHVSDLLKCIRLKHIPTKVNLF